VPWRHVRIDEISMQMTPLVKIRRAHAAKARWAERKAQEVKTMTFSQNVTKLSHLRDDEGGMNSTKLSFKPETKADPSLRVEAQLKVAESGRRLLSLPNSKRSNPLPPLAP